MPNDKAQNPNDAPFCLCEADAASRSNLSGLGKNGDCHASLAMTNDKKAGLAFKHLDFPDAIGVIWTSALGIPSSPLSPGGRELE